ncbi:NIL domain-containing protein [Merismopedia glauca]|uniref:ABC transporter n=1 Tax=Merismopedia glauca CCAP 1448/3 TaxID=1296344 RepID=A0A2T1C8Q3_9CYAN|nr:NIL domain-containing protein [Merismopedia glauca]PSB04527.1 ABC transporter [Merismopedia glauca CCAP 1448/3]
MTTQNRLTSKRIRLRIPRDYHQEPIISRLVLESGLNINIAAAILGGNGVGDGWFDLDLQGTVSQIQQGINYLNDLNLQLWQEGELDGW